MKGLRNGQFQQGLAGDLILFDDVNPEFAALAGMLGNGATILAGDSDFHVNNSLAKTREILKPRRHKKVVQGAGEKELGHSGNPLGMNS